MKLTNILPLVAVATAFVVPDETIINQMIVDSENTGKSFLNKLPTKDDISSYFDNSVKDVVKFSGNAFDHAMDIATSAGEKAKSTFQCYASMTAFDGKAWLDTAIDGAEYDVHQSDEPHPPHHKKPHHGHGKPNQTVYELIAGSKYTTKLAKLISEYDDLVDALNGTAANYTVFAPTDAAFAKIPKHHGKPSKEIIKKILSYHVSADFYPAGRVLVSHTIPTIFGEEALGGEPQRLRVGFGIAKGLNINFYSKVVAINIFGSNGVIHAVDSLLLPPPPALKILQLLPAQFSTLELALVKTGLADEISKANHTGGTFFAPSNVAFRKLGPKINAFLFSNYGEKYLKALIKYHIVANQTLYSDAFYKAKTTGCHDVVTEGIPKGHYHLDLPTLLSDKDLSIDIARWGGLIQIKINGYTNVAVQDGLAKDGVIQVLTNVLIPPKTPGATDYQGEELTVTDLKSRLDVVAEKNGWFDL